eukprot:TRINITY_DN27159_c0_g1_i1.p1 TRINITY_DN27159_c0_g1~~TRINITY_DN27159_c0_g1_i1.p1  ORF type:complete len:138 (-),score=24.67 TRINITY_DN27159_c0_g1_i1:2-415(-)
MEAIDERFRQRAPGKIEVQQWIAKYHQEQHKKASKETPGKTPQKRKRENSPQRGETEKQLPRHRSKQGQLEAVNVQKKLVLARSFVEKVMRDPNYLFPGMHLEVILQILYLGTERTNDFVDILRREYCFDITQQTQY